MQFYIIEWHSMHIVAATLKIYSLQTPDTQKTCEYDHLDTGYTIQIKYYSNDL